MQLTTPPVNYLWELRALRWRDIEWGLKQRLLREGDVVSFALWNASEASSSNEIALATADPTDVWQVDRWLSSILEDRKAEPSDETIPRWVFAFLTHEYETASSLRDWSSETDSILAEFGFPSELAEVVSFFPPQDDYNPGLHSDAENIRRRIGLIYQYLQAQASKFNARMPKLRAIPG